MATNIVPSLFGLTQQQVRQQQLAEDRQFAMDFASTQATPYARERAMLGATLGSALTRGVAGLFGLKTGPEAQASAMDEALKVARNSLPPEMKNDRTAIMGKVAEVLGSNPNFQREAMQAAVQAGEFARQDKEIQVNNAYKESLTQRQNIEIEQEMMDRRGSIAYGAAKAIEKAKSPEARQKAWSNALTALGAQGANVAALAELPETEWATTLEAITESSYSGKERLAQDKLTAEMKFKAAEQLRKESHDRMIAEIAERRDNLRWQISQAQIAGANDRALLHLQAQEKKLEETFLKMQEGFRLKTRETAVNKVGLAESNKSVRNYISENFDIDPKEAAKNVEVVNNYIRAALNETNPDGSFKYPNEATAFEAAVSKFADERISTKKGFFRDKKVITKQPNKTPIKLD